MDKNYIRKIRMNKLDFIMMIYILGVFIIRALGAAKTGYAIMISDEVCHWGLSRSIFENGQTYIRGIPADRFSCLYSICIAWVHFFSDYELRYTIIYIVNSFFMVSALIPFCLLCRRIFKDEKKVLGLVILVSLLPEFAYNARILQENLFFPVVMWTFYFIYSSFKDEIIRFKSSIGLAALSFLCYWTRQAGISIALAVIVLMLWIMFYEKKFKLYLKQLIAFIVSFSGIYFISTKIYKFINPDIISIGAMSRILSNLKGEHIIYWLEGGARYLIVLLIVTGFFTMLAPFLIFEKLTLAERRLTIFTALVAVFAILESVGMFYINEDMQRIHFRYLFYVIPVILALGAKAFHILRENRVIWKKAQVAAIICCSMIGIAVIVIFDCFCVSGSSIDGNSSRFLMTRSILDRRFDMDIYKSVIKIIIILFIIVITVLILKKKNRKVFIAIIVYFCIIQAANNYLCYMTEYICKKSGIAQIGTDSDELNEYLSNTIKDNEMVALISEGYFGHMIELHISNFPLYIISYEQLVKDSGNIGLLPNSQIQYQGFGISKLGSPPDFIIINKSLQMTFLSYETVYESSNYKVLKKTSDIFVIGTTLLYDITGLTEDRWITDNAVTISINSAEEIDGIQLKFNYLPGTILGLTASDGNEYIYDLRENNGIIEYFIDTGNVTSVQLTLYGIKTIKPSDIYIESPDERNLCAQLLSIGRIH